MFGHWRGWKWKFWWGLLGLVESFKFQVKVLMRPFGPLAVFWCLLAIVHIAHIVHACKEIKLKFDLQRMVERKSSIFTFGAFVLKLVFTCMFCFQVRRRRSVQAPHASPGAWGPTSPWSRERGWEYIHLNSIFEQCYLRISNSSRERGWKSFYDWSTNNTSQEMGVSLQFWGKSIFEELSLCLKTLSFTQSAREFFRDKIM